ncbi:MAG TPA: ABC transporter permease [Longimicrobium sp.]|nr:ABC transporter permease [Longimicrobium sp.]
MDGFLHDLRYALRGLRRSPGFAAAAVLTLALGIGLNAALFSVVNGVLLRPLPYRDPGGLVRLYHVHPEQAPDGGPFSPQDLDDLRAADTGFQSLAAWHYQPGETGLNLAGGGAEPRRVEVAFVSRELLPMLGVPAALGRTLRDDENQPGSDRVVVLSDAFWRSRFNADPGVVGRTVILDGEPWTVAGVMPPSFAFPAREAEAWAPLSRIGENDLPHTRGLRWMEVVGRLRPGVTPAAALPRVDAVLRRLAEGYGDSNDGWTRARVQTLRDAVVGPVRPALLVLMGTVLLVLAVACANLANLLLARASARRREIAIRTALGATRGRLVRQMLTESLVLALLGGALGLALAGTGVRALLALSAGTIPRGAEVGVDGRVALFALLLSLLTAGVFGLLPALRAVDGATGETLRDGGRGGTERRGAGLRAALVLAQTAAAMVLLVGAGLLVHSFWRLVRVDPGFRPANVLLVSFDIPFYRYDSPRKLNDYRDELLRRVRELPGVVAAGAAKTQPLRGGGEPYVFTLPGRSGPGATLNLSAGTHLATPGYFSALGIPVLRGRVFEPADDRRDAPLVLVVNQSAARRYWPGADPVGERVEMNGAPFTVIGVVGDVRTEGFATPPGPAVYFPFSLAPRVATRIFVRTRGDPAALAPAVRRAIHQVDPQQPIGEVRTLQSAMADTVAQPRFFTLLLAVFGSVAVLLAALGLYGVVSYSVTRRTAEIGIRMALGAQPHQVVGLELRRSARPTLAGIVVGAAGALLLSRLLASLLFEVRPADPATFAAAAAVLAVVALAAAWLPARRAAKIDPTSALRAD